MTAGTQRRDQPTRRPARPAPKLWRTLCIQVAHSHQHGAAGRQCGVVPGPTRRARLHLRASYTQISYGQPADDASRFARVVQRRLRSLATVTVTLMNSEIIESRSAPFESLTVTASRPWLPSR